MSRGLQSTSQLVINALIDEGTWMTPDALRGLWPGGIGSVLEDALADLVIDGTVDYRENVGYRLAGTLVCRKAARLMRREGKRAAVFAEPREDGYHVGVAEHRADLGLVMYELALPLPDPDKDALQAHLEQVGGVIKFANSIGGGDAGTNF